MDTLEHILNTQLWGISAWRYAASFGAILLGFIAKKIVGSLLTRLSVAAEKTRFTFDDILFGALTRPAQWAALLAGVFAAIMLLPLPEEPFDLNKLVVALAKGVSVSLVIWFSIRLVDRLMDVWAEKAAQTETRLDDQLVPIVRRSAKVFLFIIGLVLMLQNLGYSVGSLLAGLGIGGVAIAMASKDTVANLFGSFVVFLDRPFQIGDWIEMGETEGTVEEVGLRTTRIRTFANSLITVPNAMFTTKSINNWSRMKKRRIKLTVGVTYDTAPEQVEQLVTRIRNIIKNDDAILNDFYLVNFDSFGPSSLDLFIYCFTSTTVWAEFLEAKQHFMLEIMRAVDDLGLSFAFPTQSIHLEQMPEGFPKSMSGQRPG
jgi:MscS family membrane protein